MDSRKDLGKIVVGICIVLAFMAIACGKPTPAVLNITPAPGVPTVDSKTLSLLLTRVAQYSPGLPKDYFPTETGKNWNYQITIGSVEPISYREIAWPISENEAELQGVWSRYLPFMQNQGTKTFSLSYKIKGPATKEGRLKYPNAVEIEVVTDELGVYIDANQVFWAIIPGDAIAQYQVSELILYPPQDIHTPQNDQNSLSNEGWTMHMLFFGSRPGIGIGMDEDSQEKLFYIGANTDVPGYSGQKLLHFQRQVEPSKTMSFLGSLLGRAFTEDTWFAKGMGMVKLVQKFGEETSMTWELVTPAPAPHNSNLLPASFIQGQ